MKITRFLKTVFLMDFISGMLIAIKEISNQKKQLITHMKKDHLAHGLEVNMP